MRNWIRSGERLDGEKDYLRFRSWRCRWCSAGVQRQLTFRALIGLPILRRIFAASWRPLVSAEESPPAEEYLGTLYGPMTLWENGQVIVL